MRDEFAYAQEQILELIDKHTAPCIMSKSEAKEFLEELSTDLDGRIDCLREEMEEEEEDE